jgi:hypothetical protein
VALDVRELDDGERPQRLSRQREQDRHGQLHAVAPRRGRPKRAIRELEDHRGGDEPEQMHRGHDAERHDDGAVRHHQLPPGMADDGEGAGDRDAGHDSPDGCAAPRRERSHHQWEVIRPT